MCLQGLKLCGRHSRLLGRYIEEDNWGVMGSLGWLGPHKAMIKIGFFLRWIRKNPGFPT